MVKEEKLKFHYHCKECGSPMQKGFILPSSLRRYKEGITVVYYCNCGQLYVDYEDKKGQWIII